jgi:hypothetical protein
MLHITCKLPRLNVICSIALLPFCCMLNFKFVYCNASEQTIIAAVLLAYCTVHGMTFQATHNVFIHLVMDNYIMRYIKLQQQYCLM